MKRGASDNIQFLRKNATPSERLLLNALKQEHSKHGWHWQFQFPVAGYILDFFERAKQLAIEVDGEQHTFDAAHNLNDAFRDRALLAKGIRTLRFKNSEVEFDVADVVKRIAVEFAKPLATPVPMKSAQAKIPRRADGEPPEIDLRGLGILQRVIAADPVLGKNKRTSWPDLDASPPQTGPLVSKRCQKCQQMMHFVPASQNNHESCASSPSSSRQRLQTKAAIDRVLRLTEINWEKQFVCPTCLSVKSKTDDIQLILRAGRKAFFNGPYVAPQCDACFAANR